MAASAILFRLAPGISSFLKDGRVILQINFEFRRNRLINDRVIAFSMAKQRWRRRPYCFQFALPVSILLRWACHFVSAFQISSKSVDKCQSWSGLIV